MPIHLRTIKLEGNKLTHLPFIFREKKTSVRYLDLSHNRLKNLPFGYQNMRKRFSFFLFSSFSFFVSLFLSFLSLFLSFFLSFFFCFFLCLSSLFIFSLMHLDIRGNMMQTFPFGLIFFPLLRVRFIYSFLFSFSLSLSLSLSSLTINHQIYLSRPSKLVIIPLQNQDLPLLEGVYVKELLMTVLFL